MEGRGFGRLILVGIFLWIFFIFCFLVLAIFIDWQ